MDAQESYQHISRILYQVLNDTGVTVETRKLMIERCISKENLTHFTSLNYHDRNVYICGSTYEGTTTPGLKSDLDVVSVLSNLPKVADISDCPLGKSLALIQDHSAPAGYFNLQLVYNRVPLFEQQSAVFGRTFFDIWQQQFFAVCSNKDSRLVCYFNPSCFISQMYDGMHGPAMLHNQRKTFSATDDVTALESSTWPDCASEWLVRQRHFQWPSTDMIQRCKELGCLFVPKGHPFSEEPHLQWRVSLTLQERFLVTQFNSVQLKCYVFLKMIKKEKVDCHMEDVLSSYHLKTCMFYMIENTPTDFWRPEKLLDCYIGCLKTVLLCIERGNLPNYFIPAENMLDRLPQGHERLQLCRILQDLVSTDYTVFNDIQCDRLGDRLRVLPTYFGVNVQYGACFTIQQQYHVQICYSHLWDCLFPRLTFLHSRCSRNLETCVTALIKSVYKLKEPLAVTKHTEEEDKRALSHYIPYIELSLMSGLISVAVRQGRDQDLLLAYMTSTKWQEIADKSDIFSAKLKQASLMYNMGFHIQALDVLSPLVAVRRISICGCHRETDLYQITASLVEASAAISEITTEKLLKMSIVPCVIYTETEKEVTPAAINYEFLRASDVTTEIIDPEDRFSDKVIAIDGNFLLHFLLYLNHYQLNMDVHAAADIDNMESLLTSLNVCHKETCLNLLGWVYKEQDQIDRAIVSFEKSIDIKPYCNAAFWHMKDIETITSYENTQER